MAIYLDPQLCADDLRDELFAGHLVLLTGLPAVLELVTHTREELAALFAPHHPEQAHDHYTPDELAAVLGTWKPSFIHGRRSSELIRAVIEQAGFAPEHTYFDLPKPRTSFPQGHLNTGAAFAFPWHRDQWYAAPAQQINWWLPVFPLQKENAMSFDLAHFARPVPNDSHLFDSYQNNVARLTTAAQVTHEVQVRPRALDHHADQELVLLPAPGSILLFSGAHLHKTIPNSSGRARFSVDFRTVDASDLLSHRGAPVPDAHC